MMMMCVEMDWILMTVSEPKFESEIECNAVINVTKLTLGTKTALDFNGASYFVLVVVGLSVSYRSEFVANSQTNSVTSSARSPPAHP